MTREHPVQKKFPSQTLNNTTVNTLGNSEAVIEVFPPEIFFKGKIITELPQQHQVIIFKILYLK